MYLSSMYMLTVQLIYSYGTVDVTEVHEVPASTYIDTSKETTQLLYR